MNRWSKAEIAQWKLANEKATELNQGDMNEALEIVATLQGNVRRGEATVAMLADEMLVLITEIERRRPVDEIVKEWVVSAKINAAGILSGMLEPVPDYAHLMTVDAFVADVKAGNYIDYDGMGYYATETEMSRLRARPSVMVTGEVSKTFTHVAWFNK